MGQQLPVSVILNYNKQDGTYSIDADKSFDATIDSNVLADYVSLRSSLAPVHSNLLTNVECDLKI